MAALEKHHPELSVKCIHCRPEEWLKGLSNKPIRINAHLNGQVGEEWDTTLFLDADTVVLGDLSYGFEAAERHGLACCVGECPWLRRFDRNLGDMVEYNTGVIFFSQKARPVLERWLELDPHSPGSTVDVGHGPCGLERDDQHSFSRAVYETGFNPYVLPMNWNLRPGWHTRFFLPVKVWHSQHQVPDGLEQMSLACERGQRPVQMCTLGSPAQIKMFGGLDVIG